MFRNFPFGYESYIGIPASEKCKIKGKLVGKYEREKLFGRRFFISITIDNESNTGIPGYSWVYSLQVGNTGQETEANQRL